MKKTAKPVQSKRYFHEVIEEEEKILNIGLKMSRQHKKERLDREVKKTESERSTRRIGTYKRMKTFNTKKVDWMKQPMFFGEEPNTQRYRSTEVSYIREVESTTVRFLLET